MPNRLHSGNVFSLPDSGEDYLSIFDPLLFPGTEKKNAPYQEGSIYILKGKYG